MSHHDGFSVLLVQRKGMKDYSSVLSFCLGVYHIAMFGGGNGEMEGIFLSILPPSDSGSLDSVIGHPSDTIEGI